MPNPADLARQIEQLDEMQWYDFLDELDAVSRRRRQRQAEPDRPDGSDRDAVAAWIARRHFIADSGIREIWYLPQGAPAGEIRLLDVNDRETSLDSGQSQVEAIDFALDLDGCPFRLIVADVSSEQLARIKERRLDLPPGWVLDGSTVWGRRA